VERRPAVDLDHRVQLVSSAISELGESRPLIFLALLDAGYPGDGYRVLLVLHLV
jgi:hypothetical protein